MRQNEVFTRPVSAAQICMLVLFFISCQRHAGVSDVLKDIDSASSMSAKDRRARDGLAELTDIEVSAVASKTSLTEAEAILITAAYTRGREDLKPRVEEISRADDQTGRYARSMLSSRKSVGTAPK